MTTKQLNIIDEGKGKLVGLQRIKFFIDIYCYLLDEEKGDIDKLNSNRCFDEALKLSENEIETYKIYERALDYIVKVTSNIDLKIRNAKISAYRISMLLMQLERSEFENNHKPILVTQKQYDLLSNKEKEGKNIAIVQNPPMKYITDADNYRNPNLNVDLSEDFLKGYHGELVEEDLGIMKEELEEMYASIESIRILADLLDMPNVMVLVAEPCYREIELVNDVLNSLFNNVVRDDKKHQAKLRAKLKKVLTPIDIGSLKPSEKVLKQIRKDVDSVSSFINNIPIVYLDILGRKEK